MNFRTRPDRHNAIRLREFAGRVLTGEGALTPQEDEHLNRELADIESHPACTELIVEGQKLEVPSLLLEGWAVRQRVLSDGRRQIFSFVLPGDAIGLCDTDGAHALCATVAITDVSFAHMPVLAMAVRQKSSSGLGIWGRHILAREERGLYDQVVRLGRQSAYERLAHQLLDFYYRLSHVGLLEDHSFTLPFTQEVLSDTLGLSTVHTNRTLQQLRREHLIESHGQHVQLLDLKRLAQICDYQPPASRKAISVTA